RRNGMIGNIYSMGLALQALETSGEFYAPRKWDRAQAFSVVYSHDYQQPMAIAQVLPPLVGKSYLNTGSWGCAATNGMAPSQQLLLSPTPGTIGVPTWNQARGVDTWGCPPTAAITVQFSITNTLKNYFHYSTSVCVPDNSKLLRVMEVARDEKPDIFCFTIKETNLGPFVTSIHGLAGNETERTYWQFFSCWSPLQEGVGTYKPKNWEHIQAIFSTY
ncbi:IF factor, partial [Cinclus mexicanus]|nr:IF factor [Cinclus mexicanus]